MKYERPPLFCFFCWKVGHGTKDCDTEEDEDEGIVKYGGWLKASPWKVGDIREKGHDSGREGIHSCAKVLFVTKPKEKRTSEIEKLSAVVDILDSWALQDAGKENAARKEIEGNRQVGRVTEGEDQVSVGHVIERAETGETEAREKRMGELVDDPSQRGVVYGRKVKIVRRKDRQKSTHGETPPRVSGCKRDERGGLENGLDDMEIEELRYLKRVSLVDNGELERVNGNIAAQVAGPTDRALGKQC